MSIWSRLAKAIETLSLGQALSALFEGFAKPPERSIAFTIAVIALGAKMAKADGLVTRDEVAAFRRVFYIAPEEAANAARVFNLARADVTGFESYASRIGHLLSDDRQLRIDLMEGLFHIALADGNFHPGEDAFLLRVSELLGLDEGCFRVLRARHLPEGSEDPYEILGVPADVSLAQARSAWRQLVRDLHPDGMVARGAPPEAARLAEQRLATINHAWEVIQRDRAS